MIFVVLGSQKFQFNRLLRKLDELVKGGIIQDHIFAQTGYSDYQPKYFDYQKFLNREEFLKMTEGSELVISHGGTGAIMSAVKNEKKVIAVPRLPQFQEHVDDHQLQIIRQFARMGIIIACEELEELACKLEEIQGSELRKYRSSTREIIDSMDQFLQNQSL